MKGRFDLQFALFYKEKDAIVLWTLLISLELELLKFQKSKTEKIKWLMKWNADSSPVRALRVHEGVVPRESLFTRRREGICDCSCTLHSEHREQSNRKKREQRELGRSSSARGLSALRRRLQTPADDRSTAIALLGALQLAASGAARRRPPSRRLSGASSLLLVLESPRDILKFEE